MTAIPDTMRSAVLRGTHDIVNERRPVPEPGPYEVLVRVDAVGTCGSDVHYFEHGRVGNFVVDAPLILGHEPSGTVVARGADATRHPIGQRVALEPGVPCTRCAQCLRGRYNLCPEMRFLATPPIDGAFREYLAHNEQFAYPVPDSLSDEAAGLLEPLSVGLWACSKANVGHASRVLITGAGPIGLIAVQTARAFGCRQIVVTDVNERRLELARELGASGTVNVAEKTLADSGYEPDVLLECSGIAAAVPEAIKQVGRAGRVVLVGMGGDDVALPLAHVQGFEIEVTGTFRYANTWPSAIDLVASGAVDLDRLVTHRFGLDEVERALRNSVTDDAAIKTVVRPQA